LRTRFWPHGAKYRSKGSVTIPEPAKSFDVTLHGNNGRGTKLREEKTMDIRCTSTGKVFYQVDSQIASLLIEALPSVFESIEKPITAQPPKPRWFVGKPPTSGRPILTFNHGSETLFYDGTPDGAQATFGKRQPPLEVIAAYATACEAFSPGYKGSSVTNVDYYRAIQQKDNA
jgi:hypothetical protein